MLCLASALSAQAQQFVPGELLVRFRTNAPAASPTMRFIGGQVAAHVPFTHAVVVRYRPRVPISAVLRLLRQDPTVVYAEPNYVGHTLDVNDPLYGSQWNLPKIAAPAAWGFTIGSPTVLVGMLDTGADLSHPDLAGRIAASKNFVGFGPATDGDGHGSHTAGTVAADTNNGIGVASLGYNTRLLIGKVATDNGTTNVSLLAQGISWATAGGAKVISMSIGLPAYSQTLQDAVDTAWNNGVVLVAAAGNNGNSQRVYPAALEHCVAVAATDQQDVRCSFSNFGDWIHVAAPGQSILSLYKNGKTATMSGTSMACPQVAALAALLWANGARSNEAIVRAIYNSGDPTIGFGTNYTPRINARRALLRLP